MNNTNEKKRRTVGFKLGLAQAIIYLLSALALLVLPAVFEIQNAAQRAEDKSSFISYVIKKTGPGYLNTKIDLNDDGVYEFELYTCKKDNYDYKGKPSFRKFIETVYDENDDLIWKYEYYDFVSEDMKNEVWMFENRETGENIAVSFNSVDDYKRFLENGERGYYLNYFTIPCECAGAIMVAFTVMQFVAAIKGSKSYHVNNIGIAVNTILFGYGALGLAGAIKDRKLAIANDEKHRLKLQAKAQKKLEREEREKAENGGSTFTGGAFANAGINMLTRFVCLITLGLAYPAMVCWKLRWKCSHTYVNGRQLTFDGNAAQFFGKFMLWLFLSVITLGIYYIVCMKVALAKWQTKHIHFADTVIEKDDENLSKFDGHWYQLLGVNWLCRFVTFITLSFGQYWAHCYKERWFCKHKKIDGLALTFDGKAAQYFGKRFCWNLLTIITLGIYAFWLAVKTEKWTCSHTHIKENNIKENND